VLAHAAKAILGRVLSRSLPPASDDERAFIEELLTTFRTLPVFDNADSTPSEASWGRNMNRLRTLILERDPREFLQWDVVTNTMFVFFARHVRPELRYLQGLPDWETRWRPAIEESWVGRPTRYVFYPASSGNLIHHAYHVARFEEKTGLRIENMDSILEFGGGYGSMCRLIHTLGFRGRYIILDLPPFSALQMYYLRTHGLPVATIDAFARQSSAVACVSDVDDLSQMLGSSIDVEKAMFIATWSLSETPVRVRDSVLPLVAEFQSFLIAYQDRFGEVDNVAFFDDWKSSRQNVEWSKWPAAYMPGSNYLVGSK